MYRSHVLVCGGTGCTSSGSQQIIETLKAELEKNGARIFYGNHQSAAAVADSGREIADRIQEVLAETGAEKVNIIAHSKGGLDSRYAMSQLGAAPCVASLTTVNTPHRGCEFADYLLNLIPEKQQWRQHIMRR